MMTFAHYATFYLVQAKKQDNKTEERETGMSGENQYFIPVKENPEAELARLREQDRFITEVTGVFPPAISQERIQTMHRVLDIGCGPGEFCMRAAQRYPHLEVVGIDINPEMTRYAVGQAESREIPNAHFQVANALERLPFSDEAFEYITMRFTTGWIPRVKYAPFFHECERVLKKGGYFTSTEGEAPIAGISSPAIAQGFKWVSQVLNISGKAFNDGYTSIIPSHGNFLRSVGLSEIQRYAYVGDASFGTEYYDAMRQTILILFQLLQTTIVDALKVPEQHFRETFQQIQQEIDQEDFACMCYILSTTGKKPDVTLI